MHSLQLCGPGMPASLAALLWRCVRARFMRCLAACQAGRLLSPNPPSPSPRTHTHTHFYKRTAWLLLPAMCGMHAEQAQQQAVEAATTAGSVSCRRGQWYWPAINFNVSRQTRTGNVDNAMLLLLLLSCCFSLYRFFTRYATHVVVRRQRRIQIQQTTTTTATATLTEYQLSNVKCSA